MTLFIYRHLLECGRWQLFSLSLKKRCTTNEMQLSVKKMQSLTTVCCHHCWRGSGYNVTHDEAAFTAITSNLVSHHLSRYPWIKPLYLCLHLCVSLSHSIHGEPFISLMCVRVRLNRRLGNFSDTRMNLCLCMIRLNTVKWMDAMTAERKEKKWTVSCLQSRIGSSGGGGREVNGSFCLSHCVAVAIEATCPQREVNCLEVEFKYKSHCPEESLRDTLFKKNTNCLETNTLTWIHCTRCARGWLTTSHIHRERQWL